MGMNKELSTSGCIHRQRAVAEESQQNLKEQQNSMFSYRYQKYIHIHKSKFKFTKDCRNVEIF